MANLGEHDLCEYGMMAAWLTHDSCIISICLMCDWCVINSWLKGFAQVCVFASSSLNMQTLLALRCMWHCIVTSLLGEGCLITGVVDSRGPGHPPHVTNEMRALPPLKNMSLETQATHTSMYTFIDAQTHTSVCTYDVRLLLKPIGTAILILTKPFRIWYWPIHGNSWQGDNFHC